MLRQEAAERGPGSRLSSVRELSAKLGFSQASISTALVRLEKEGIIVRRHGSGIYSASRTPATRIGVAISPEYLLRPNPSPFWNIVLGCLMKAAAAKGWECSCFVGAPGAFLGSPEEGLNPPSSWEDEVASGRISALISLGLDDRQVTSVAGRGGKIISFAGYGQVMVARNLAQMTQAAIEALSCLGQGPILAGPCEAFSLGPVRQGIAASSCPSAKPISFRGADKTPPEELNRHAWAEGMEDPVLAAKNWLLTQAPPTPFRLVSIDDMFTLGVIEGMSEKGLQLGEDIEVATHCNKGSHILAKHEDSVTRLEIDPASVAAQLVDLISDADLAGGWAKLSSLRPPDSLRPSGEMIYFTPFTLIPKGQG